VYYPLRQKVLCLFLASLVFLGNHSALAESLPVKLADLNGSVRVEVDGKLFTAYNYSQADKPFCYPILQADGTSMTRDYPMKSATDEEHDHPWHRSLWFAHSIVNGVDFWNEGNGDAGKSPSKKGKIIQEGSPQISENRLTSHDRWVDPSGTLICTDDRTLTFSATSSGRFIDVSVTLHAPADKALTMGDNKDGTMAIRLAEWMTMQHKVKGVMLGGEGHIVTATGKRDQKAWGTRSDWCDYHANHNGVTYGVAIFDSSTNYKHPTYWMARDYGLFGANPFGKHDYENLKDVHAGDLTIPAGASLTLNYRFFFHLGDEQEAHVADQYTLYIKNL